MRHVALFFVFLVAFVPGLKAQDSLSLKPQLLDDVEILEKLKELEGKRTEPLNQEANSMENINDIYSMRIKDVDELNMAKMPMMEINKDIHYTMRIKKYTNYYQKFVNKDSLEQHKNRILPLEPKVEK